MRGLAAASAKLKAFGAGITGIGTGDNQVQISGNSIFYHGDKILAVNGVTSLANDDFFFTLVGGSSSPLA